MNIPNSSFMYVTMELSLTKSYDIALISIRGKKHWISILDLYTALSTLITWSPLFLVRRHFLPSAEVHLGDLPTDSSRTSMLDAHNGGFHSAESANLTLLWDITTNCCTGLIFFVTFYIFLSYSFISVVNIYFIFAIHNCIQLFLKQGNLYICKVYFY